MIESATADRRRYGSPVVRNTYQTAITRHDLNHQRWLRKEGAEGRAYADQLHDVPYVFLANGEDILN